MADPLTTVASEFAPRPVDLFDPRESGDIYNRWSNAAAGFGTAANVVKGVADAEDLQYRRERARQDKVLFDREDAEYADKQDYEAARGNLLVDVGRMDPSAPDYESKLSGLLAATPQLADDDAFKVIVNSLQSRADEGRRAREIEEDDKRRRAAWEEETELDLINALGAAGADEGLINRLRDPETGRLNLKRAAAAAGQKKYELEVAGARAKAEAADQEDTIRTFADDTSLQDRVKSGDAAGIESLVKQREAALKGINAAFTPEDLKLSEDAFAAKLAKDLIPESLTLENEEKARARAKEISAIAKDYHRAIRARSLVGPVAPATKAEGNPAAARRYLPTLPKK